MQDMKNGKNRVHEYTAFFEASEHGGYTVTVPSIPGLVQKERIWTTLERWPRTPSAVTSKA
jgi:hypothetical protein